MPDSSARQSLGYFGHTSPYPMLMWLITLLLGRMLVANLNYWARAKSANFLEGGQDYFLDIFV